jgi:hypothetical protein
VLEIVGDERILPKLQEMLESSGNSEDLRDKINEVIQKFELVAA